MFVKCLELPGDQTQEWTSWGDSSQHGGCGEWGLGGLGPSRGSLGKPLSIRPTEEVEEWPWRPALWSVLGRTPGAQHRP